MGTEKRPGTMVYFDLLTPVEALNMEERGQLFTAILQYGSKGEEPVFSGMLHMAWLFVKEDMKRDRAKYEAICKKRKSASAERWEKESGDKKADVEMNTSASSESECMQMDANASSESKCMQMDANASNASEYMQMDASDTNSTQPNSTQLNSTQPNTTQFIKGGADAPAPRRQKKFIPPSVEEVEAYCNEKGYRLDAAQFVDFYTASGWMRGNTKIRDWKACVRTWRQRQNDQTSQREPPPPQFDFERDGLYL